MVAEALRVDPCAHTPGPDAITRPFELTAGAYTATDLRVLSFRGREAISRPFRFDITLAADHLDAGSFEADVLGQTACLRLNTPGHEPRTVHGTPSACAWCPRSGS
jgi:uncharacterized protein involved in type VI secretion and phage assembly